MKINWMFQSRLESLGGIGKKKKKKLVCASSVRRQMSSLSVGDNSNLQTNIKNLQNWLHLLPLQNTVYTQQKIPSQKGEKSFEWKTRKRKRKKKHRRKFASTNSFLLSLPFPPLSMRNDSKLYSLEMSTKFCVCLCLPETDEREKSLRGMENRNESQVTGEVMAEVGNICELCHL